MHAGMLEDRPTQWVRKSQAAAAVEWFRSTPESNARRATSASNTRPPTKTTQNEFDKLVMSQCRKPYGPTATRPQIEPSHYGTVLRMSHEFELRWLRRLSSPSRGTRRLGTRQVFGTTGSFGEWRFPTCPPRNRCFCKFLVAALTATVESAVAHNRPWCLAARFLRAGLVRLRTASPSSAWPTAKGQAGFVPPPPPPSPHAIENNIPVGAAASRNQQKKNAKLESAQTTGPLDKLALNRGAACVVMATRGLDAAPAFARRLRPRHALDVHWQAKPGHPGDPHVQAGAPPPIGGLLRLPALFLLFCSSLFFIVLELSPAQDANGQGAKGPMHKEIFITQCSNLTRAR